MASGGLIIHLMHRRDSTQSKISIMRRTFDRMLSVILNILNNSSNDLETNALYSGAGKAGPHCPMLVREMGHFESSQCSH